MSGKLPEISVLIPCHEGAHRLDETLAALATEAFPGELLEVIVADDGSEEAVPRDLGSALPFPVRVVRLDSNRGRASACNRALSEAKGRVVLVLDDDMSAVGSLLAEHLAAHPAGGTSRAVIGRIETDPEFFRGRFGAFLAEEEEERQTRLQSAGDAIPFTHCLTGHFSIPRDTLRGAGAYCEAFSRYGFEDIELAWRLERAGVPLVFRSELRTRHRSEHASFERHCERHFDSGVMALLFSRSAKDPRVDAFLRIDGMPWAEQRGAFRKLMTFYHSMARHTPAALLPALLWGARIKAAGFAWILPRRMRHVIYHIVRDMHYAAGIAEAKRQKDKAT